MDWKPEPIWTGQDCYIVGGGPSLKEFDWNLLRERNVLGCNAAFYLGADIVPVTVFGDAAFWPRHRDGLDEYVEQGGQVVTCALTVERFGLADYLKITKGIKGRVSKEGLCWNANTGSAAINLALQFGAERIYLLGFDMQLDQNGDKNFHNAYNDDKRAESYLRFKKHMAGMRQQIASMFPDQEVINLEDGTSILEEFPKKSLKKHFEKE